MGNRANRLELKHEVEGGDFEHPDLGQVEHIGHGLDHRFGNPAFLLLPAPQQRDHGAGLTALRKLGDLLRRPGLVGRGESEAFGLGVV